MRVLASYNIKGGVGKTAAAVNLAHLAAEAGHRTLLWDLDPQGAASFYFRIKPRVKGGGGRLLKRRELERHVKGTGYSNLDLLPADFSYRHLDLALNEYKKPTGRLRKVLRDLKDEYDVALLDCAPSISLVSEGVFEAADMLLVPTIPTTMSVQTARRIVRFFVKHGLEDTDLVGFFSMVDRRRALHRQIVEDRADLGITMLETIIPYAAEVERMGARRGPVTGFAPRSPAAQAFRDLWGEVEGRLSRGDGDPSGGS